MVKQNQFIGKASYVEPAIKSVVLDARATMMNVTSPGGYNTNGLVDLNGDDVVNQNDGWGLGNI